MADRPPPQHYKQTREGNPPNGQARRVDGMDTPRYARSSEGSERKREAPRPPTDSNRWGVSPFGDIPRGDSPHGRCEKGSQRIRRFIPATKASSSPIRIIRATHQNQRGSNAKSTDADRSRGKASGKTRIETKHRTGIVDRGHKPSHGKVSEGLDTSPDRTWTGHKSHGIVRIKTRHET